MRTLAHEIASPDRKEQELRAWLPQCGSGDGALLTAMRMAECVEYSGKTIGVQVFATNTHALVVAAARAARFIETTLSTFPDVYIRKYWGIDKAQPPAEKPLRAKLTFSVLDILKHSPLPRIDFISAGAMLNHLSDEETAIVVSKFHFALRPGGILCIDNRQRIDLDKELFRPIDKTNGIFAAKTLVQPIRSEWYPGDRYLRHTMYKLLQPQDSSRSERRVDKSLGFDNVTRAPAPSILVDANLRIVHIGEGAGEFLSDPIGSATDDLIARVKPIFKSDLRTLLFKVVIEGGAFDVRRRGYPLGEWIGNVTITARPITLDAEDYVLVSFGAVNASLDDLGVESHLGVDDRLENEMSGFSRRLRQTVEESDAALLTLSLAHEEAQAASEELQAIAEEMEAHIAELQSSNGTLEMANSALQLKNDDLMRRDAEHCDFIAAIPLPIVLLDEQMRLRRFTREAGTIFRFQQSDVGRSAFDINHTLDWPTYAEDLYSISTGNESMDRELAHADGRHFIARIKRADHIDNLSNGVLLTLFDVTGLRGIEQNARTTQAQMTLLAKSTKDYAIVTLDKHGIISSWNVGAEKIFGYREEKAVGQNGSIIFLDDDAGKRAFETELRTALIEGRSDDERWHRRENGEKVYCSGVLFALYQDDGRFEGFAKIARDNTRQERLTRLRSQRLSREKAVRLAAEHANHLKDQFLAITSHELKHPLNLIGVNAELLSRLPGASQEDGMTAKALRNILGAVSSQARIIDDLLDLSRVSTGKLRLDVTSVEIVAVTEAIIAAAREVALQKRVELSFLSDQATLVISVDIVRYEQIVWNLVSNALKFTPAEGSVTVSLHRNNDTVLLVVTDTGIGMENFDLDVAFDLFAQAPVTASASMGGLGIGLALVKEFAESHGGQVQAISQGLGRGLTVKVWFPEQPRKLAIPSNEGAQTSLAGLTVLVVDDSVEGSEALAALLETAGLIVQTASSGKVALQMIESTGFDFLISDIAMPEMDGYELISQVRTLASGRRLSALALTGYAGHTDQIKSIEAGFDRCLSKPISLASLQQSLLETHLRKDSRLHQRKS